MATFSPRWSIFVFGIAHIMTWVGCLQMKWNHVTELIMIPTPSKASLCEDICCSQRVTVNPSNCMIKTQIFDSLLLTPWDVLGLILGMFISICLKLFTSKQNTVVKHFSKTGPSPKRKYKCCLSIYHFSSHCNILFMLLKFSYISFITNRNCPLTKQYIWMKYI